MEKNLIKINVIGQTAIGKSSVAWYILSKLKELGFEIEISDQSKDDFGTIENFEHHMLHDFNNIEERMKIIKDKTKIIIGEKQTCCEPIKQ